MPMLDEPIALISDIHGNIWALEAVLKDIDRRQIGRVLNLGDSVCGPLDPGSTAEVLMGRNFTTVRGNEDRIVTELVEDELASETVRFVRERLTDEQLQWLAFLPPSRTLEDEIWLFHASPTNDAEYLLWESVDSGVRARSSEEIATKLPPWSNGVFACGHDHIQRTVQLRDGRIVVDPGSVGLPAYLDDLPSPHAMESGSPHARYSILARTSGRWRAENVAVEYDWEAAAHIAGRNGRPDWARWLRTGLAA